MAPVNDSVLSRQTVIVFGIVTAVATIVATYIYQRSKKIKIPTEWSSVGKVGRLCLYPLKSGRRLEVQEAECTQQGLKEVEKPDKSLRLRDRSFVVYKANDYEFRTARQYPKLVLVELRARDANTVALNAPNMETLLLKIPSRKDRKFIIIKQFKQEEIKCMDCGDEAAAWISKYLLEKDYGLRIAYNDGTYKRSQINVLYKDLVDFYGGGLRNESAGLNSDLGAMHIINNASALDCIRKVGNNDVTVNNFRPTLLVEGPDLKPFDEDNWEWIKVGEVVMKNVVPCFRCILPTINPENGIRRDDREPLKSLESYRKREGPEKTPVMGILLEVHKTGNISVGDTVYVSKSS